MLLQYTFQRALHRIAAAVEAVLRSRTAQHCLSLQGLPLNTLNSISISFFLSPAHLDDLASAGGDRAPERSTPDSGALAGQLVTFHSFYSSLTLLTLAVPTLSTIVAYRSTFLFTSARNLMRCQ